MGGFLIRRTGAALVVLVAASVLVFLGVRAIPGDPAIALGAEGRDPALLAAIRHKYLLDQPLPVQYTHWVWLAVHGDLGVDQRELSVAHTIVSGFPSARARGARNDLLDAHGIPGGGDRRGPARKTQRLRRDDGRARRPLGAAFLARPADDQLVRRRPALAARERVRDHAPPDREPRAHADAGHRARRRPLRGLMRQTRSSMLDVPRRRLRAHGAREGSQRVVGGPQPRAAKQPRSR